MKIPFGIEFKAILSLARRQARLISICMVALCCWDHRAAAETTIRVIPATLSVAREALKHPQGPTRVLFAAGQYFLDAPLIFSDSSTPVVLQAEGEVVMSGGVALRGWRQATLNGHACLAVEIPQVKSGQIYFRELWVNAKRATRARHPKTSYLAATVPQDTKTPWNKGQNWFGYKPGNIPDDLAPDDVEAVILNRWVETRFPILRIDRATHRIQSSKSSPFQLLNGDLYYLEGSPAFLDQPGDWYLDRASGTLYYLPRSGESAESIDAIAPCREELLKANNVSDLTLRGLTFSHSEWNLPDAAPGGPALVGGFSQAAIGVCAAVSLEHAHNCHIESCHFEHLGNYALEIGKACQHNLIEHCTFTDFGAGAIKIGNGEISHKPSDQCLGNAVTDCRITDGGQMFPSACGIWIGQSFDNTIEHNEIADLYYTAISAGWTWGYGDSLARENRITSNLIHHIGQKSNGDGPVLSDMGAIYLLGARAGTLVSGNVIHDINGKNYGGWGIYLDEGSSDVEVRNNLVYRTTHGGFHLHYGHNNRVENNVFALGRDVQIARTKTDSELSLTFRHNLIFWNTGICTSSDYPGAVFDENLYQCAGDHQKFSGKSWAQWQAAGQDLHSILMPTVAIAEPTADLAAHPGADANRIQFQAFDCSAAGPR